MVELQTWGRIPALPGPRTRSYGASVDPSMPIRPPAVAGMFYPSDPDELARSVEAYIDQADTVPLPGPIPAIIAPHAGYPYSGPVAGSAYRAVREANPGAILRVILISPAHRVPVRGVARAGAAGFATPLGELAVDHAYEDRLDGMEGVTTSPPAHRDEHGIEVHLPFLQRLLGSPTIVPLVVGDDDGRVVASILDRLQPGRDTLVVISSDLSHFLSQREAQALDRETADLIVGRQPSSLTGNHACGYLAIRGLLLSDWAKHLTARCIDLRTSADTAGTPSRVVGYGAFLFSPS